MPPGAPVSGTIRTSEIRPRRSSVACGFSSGWFSVSASSAIFFR